MSALVTLAAAGFRRYSAYRLATAAGAFTNSAFGLIRASITVAAITAAGGMLADYDAKAGSTYVWITQALITPVALFGWNELALRIRTGDVAIDLARPLDLQWGLLATDLGRAAFVLIPRGLPPIVVGALTFGLAMPSSPWPYVAGAISIALAVMISFGCRFLVNLTAFWMLDAKGAITLYVVVSNVLCGLLVPVHWFPGWMRRLAAATPFPSMIQAPVDVLTGRAGGSAALAVLAVQVWWLGAVLVLGRLVLRSATRHLVVQGG